ncbi:hypothetical protein [uncultured Meiothermus sp.]|uniref:hypothetical protein n=1 Tax=uncultured Meiothermus sp. TaxID=157471 RepID=UPI002607F707|nr:hypothetical protein [uncultured Meiothermus sp.]
MARRRVPVVALAPVFGGGRGLGRGVAHRGMILRGHDLAVARRGMIHGCGGAHCLVACLGRVARVGVVVVLAVGLRHVVAGDLGVARLAAGRVVPALGAVVPCPLYGLVQGVRAGLRRVVAEVRHRPAAIQVNRAHAGQAPQKILEPALLGAVVAVLEGDLENRRACCSLHLIPPVAGAPALLR